MMASVVWQQGKVFRARTGSGHQVVTDAVGTGGAPGDGASPMELLLVALGSCTATDVVGILEKMRQPFTGVSVKVVGERAEDDPRIFTMIDLEYTVRGEGLDPASVKRAIHLSHERYCSVAATLRPTASIRYSWRIEEVAARQVA